MNDQHLCPRRGEAPSHRTEHDTWRVDAEGIRTCSYCGSLHEEDFMTAALEQCELGPTDKSYKVYVDLKNPDPTLLICKGTSTHPTGGYKPVEEVPEEILARSHKSYREAKYVLVKPVGQKKFGKFYFQHLSKENQQVFIDLYNTGSYNVGVPGHFYRIPFFCERVNKNL